MPRVRSDTRRLLLLLQVLHRRPGIRLDRLARTLGESERDVLRDLTRLSLCGVPPFTPDDYLDAYVERGRVFIRGAAGFRGGTRLTPLEAVSLLAALRFLEQSGGGPGAFPAVRSAARKIEDALAGEKRLETAELKRRVAWEPAAGADPRVFQTLREALTERRIVDLTYYSESADELHHGRIHPYELAFARGNWYVIGQSEARGEVRTLRVDRVQHARLLADRYTIPEGFAAKDYVTTTMMPRGGEMEVVLVIRPPLAELAAEDYPEARTDGEGKLTVTFRTTDAGWVARQALRWAPHAEVVSPPEAREAVARLAEDLNAVYRGR